MFINVFTLMDVTMSMLRGCFVGYLRSYYYRLFWSSFLLLLLFFFFCFYIIREARTTTESFSRHASWFSCQEINNHKFLFFQAAGKHDRNCLNWFSGCDCGIYCLYSISPFKIKSCFFYNCSTQKSLGDRFRCQFIRKEVEPKVLSNIRA